MSWTLSTKCGPLGSLKISARCGCRPKAPQMRQIDVFGSPTSFAIECSAHWVACAGREVSVRSITSKTR